MTTGRRLLLAVVCGVAVASVYAAQPVLDSMGRDLGVSPGRTGWIVAAGQVGYLAGLVLLVPLGDLRDRPRLIALHLVLIAMGMATVAASPTAWVALAGVAAAGLFAVVVQTTVAYAASLAAPEDRGRTIGVVTSGVVVGILGARVVAGALAQVASWRAVFAAIAVLALVLAAATRALPREEREDRPAGYRDALVSLGGRFRERLFLTRGLIAFFLFASFGTLWSGLSLSLAGAPWHLGEAQIGLFGVAGLAGALGAARSGRWADRGWAHRVTGGSLALLLVSWAAIGQLPSSLVLLGVGIVVLDFAVQAVHVSNQQLLTAAHPERTSSVIGGYMVFYSLGSALGAAATTATFEAHGWTGSTLLGAALALAGLVVWAIDRQNANGRPAGRPSKRSEKVRGG